MIVIFYSTKGDNAGQLRIRVFKRVILGWKGTEVFNLPDEQLGLNRSKN